MKLSLRRNPPAVASIVFLVLLAGMVLAATHLAHGLFVYPLDDSYIHLALARTLAVHHVWGIGPTEFASASSSPGWTVLLALLDLLVGPHLLNALFLNVLFAIPLIFSVDATLRQLRPDASLGYRTTAQILILLCTSVPNLAYVGMEHVAQTLSILLLVTFGVRILALAPTSPIPRGLTISLLLSSLFAGAIRYEAVFAIVPIFLLLLLRRRISLAIFSAAAAAAGPLSFGLYSHRISGLWLPFSVLMKASLNAVPTHNPILRYQMLSSGGGFRQILLAPALLWLLRLRRWGFWTASQMLLFVTSILIFFHLGLAPTRWLLRYESYFFLLSMVSLAVAAPRLGSPAEIGPRLRTLAPAQKLTSALLALTLLVLAPFLFWRAISGIFRGPLCSVDRFNEHVQIARFLHSFYDHDSVVVNDIGAVSYYSDSHLLDPIGLGSGLPVLIEQRLHRPLNAAELSRWTVAEHAPVAIIQTDWPVIRTRVPPTWIPVQTWVLSRNIVFGTFHITLFAPDPSDIPRLCESANRFDLTPADHRYGTAVCPVGRFSAAR